jgi:GNAT superfamily N-acetyltransferase
MTESISYRPPRRAELADCAMIWYSAVDDYMARLNRPLPSPYLDPLLALLEHLLVTDSERFLVAVRPATRGDPNRGERVVGFGIAVQREHVWFLSQLYVLPDEQRRGIGRAILTQIMPSIAQAPLPDEAAAAGGTGDSNVASAVGVTGAAGAAGDRPDRRNGIMATCTDSVQPASNGLYSRYGIVPRVPVFNLVGYPVNPSPMPALPAGVEAVAIDRQGPRAARVAAVRATTGELEHAAPDHLGAARANDSIDRAIDSIDRAVLGYAHPADHAYLRAMGRSGFVYMTSAGEPVGYGYSSEVGRFGPVSLLDETLTAAVIGHLMATIKPRGATSAWIPGANDRAMVAMLRSGMRIEGFPAQLCWTRPFAAFDRYVPASLALL